MWREQELPTQSCCPASQMEARLALQSAACFIPAPPSGLRAHPTFPLPSAGLPKDSGSWLRLASSLFSAMDSPQDELIGGPFPNKSLGPGRGPSCLSCACLALGRQRGRLGPQKEDGPLRKGRGRALPQPPPLHGAPKPVLMWRGQGPS